MKRRDRLTKIANLVETVDDHCKTKREIAKDIFKRWPDKLDIYTFVEDTNELRLGDYINYVDINLTGIHGGILVKMFRDAVGTLRRILLMTPDREQRFLWYIRPTHKYLFRFNRGEVNARTTRLMNKLREAGFIQ
jgi:hypothetical protein